MLSIIKKFSFKLGLENYREGFGLACLGSYTHPLARGWQAMAHLCVSVNQVLLEHGCTHLHIYLWLILE